MRTAIAVQEVASNNAAQLNEAAVDAANGMIFPNDGRTVLVVRNAGASALSITLKGVACSHGRAADVVVAALAAGRVYLSTYLETGLFSQKAGADSGQVYVDFAGADAANAKVSAVRTV